MHWKNLKNNYCPKCKSSLKKSEDKFIKLCSNLKCDFKITVDKYNELIEELNKPIN